MKSLLEQITAQEPEEEHPLPKYSDPGRILVHVLGPGPALLDEKNYHGDRYDIEVYASDDDSCVMWISEGIGLDYFIQEHCEFWIPGWYVIEGITGEYHKGEWGITDDDEYWDYDSIRPATPEEIATESLCDMETK